MILEMCIDASESRWICKWCDHRNKDYSTSFCEKCGRNHNGLNRQEEAEEADRRLTARLTKEWNEFRRSH